MIKIKKETLFKILIIPFLLMLSACTDTEAIDANCLKEISKLEVTSKSCKPLNEFSKSINVKYYNSVNEPTYSDSKMLSAEDINIYNNRQIKLNQNTKSTQEAKKAFVNIYLKFLGYLMFILVPVALFKNMHVPEGQEIKRLPTFLIISTLASFFFYIYSSDDFTVRYKNFVNSVNQYIFTTGAVVVLEKSTVQKSEISNNSKNEALRDKEAIHKINICMGNNQKNYLERLENTYNRLLTQKDVVDAYYSKNKPYLKFYEKRTNEKISYQVDKFGITNRVSFANCGEITTTPKNISTELYEIMEYVNFNHILHEAIQKSTLEKSWETIQEKYDSKYLLNKKSKTRLMQLFIIYLVEYKKGQIIGSVEVDYVAGKSSDYLAGTRPVIDFDTSNLEALLSESDEIYSNINQSICITRPDLVKDTIERIERFDTTQHMSQYDCVDFKDDKLTASTTSNRIYNSDNEQEINTNVMRIVTKTRKLVDESTIDLVNEYERVDKLYLKIVDGLYDFDEDVLKILNRGFYAYGDFYKYINTHSNEYLSFYTELNDVLNISYSKSLPNYSSGDDTTESNLYAYESGYVNHFMKPILDQIDTSYSNAPSNYGSLSLEIATDTTSYNIDKEEMFSMSNAENLLNTGLKAMTNVFNSAKRMTCNDDKSCTEQQKNYNGVLEIQNLSSDLKIGATLGLSTAVATKISAITLKAIAKQTQNKKQKSTFKTGKDKKKKGNLFGNAISTAGSTLDGVSIFMFITSVIALIISALIDFIFKIEEIFMIFVQLIQMQFLSYLDFFLLNTIAVGFAVGTSNKIFINVIMRCFKLIMYLPVSAIAFGLIVILNNVIRTKLLNILPFVSEITGSSINDGSFIISIALPIIQIAVNLIVIYFGTKWFFKEILAKFKPLVDKTIRGSLSSVEEFINEKENAKLYTSVYTASKMIKISNSQNNADKEENTKK